jgi:hypothetical protein
MMKQNQTLAGCGQTILSTIVLLLLFFCTQQLQAQTSISQVTTVPLTDMNVGTNNVVPFTTVITNTGTDDITINTIALTLPSGVYISDPSLVTLSSGGASIPFTLSADNQTITVTNQSPTINGYVLPSKATMTLSYSAKANCNAIPNISGDKFVVNVANTTTITYNTTLSDQKVSSSYNITFPDIFINTFFSSSNTRTVTYQSNYVDNVTVTNFTGGPANNMIFSMTLTDPSFLSSPSFTVIANGTTVPVTATITNGVASFIINHALLSQLGFENDFVPGALLTVQPSFTVLKYFATMQATFSVQLYSDAKSCTNLFNASGIVKYNQLYPDGDLTIQRKTIQLANWCTNYFIADYTISNLATNIPSNTFSNTGFSFGLIDCSIESVTLQDGSTNGIVL